MKKIVLIKDIRRASLTALAKLAGIVGKTLGPGGLPIILQREGQALNGRPLGPQITKDGVSVSEKCCGATPEEDLIIQTAKGICKKTNSEAGDGTTTAIVLGQAILKESLETLYSKGRSHINPQFLKKSLDLAGKQVLIDLTSQATPLTSRDEVANVATLSANGDEQVGRVIAEAFHSVGAEGVVTVDEGSGEDVTLQVIDGYRFDRGAQSRQNFFNNKDLTAFEAEGVSVVLYDGALRSHLDVIPLLLLQADVDEATGKAGKQFPPTIIIANEFSRDVLQFLLIQKAERGLQLCPVVGPNLTHIRTGYYDDLAAYTGGCRMGNGGLNLREVKPEHIGKVSKAVINGYHTTLYGGGGREEDVLARVDHLTALRDEAESPFDAQICSDRIASLTNGVAKISVGGSTEVEILEKYDRIEDALNSARAALQEGVVVGGGVTLLKIARKLQFKEDPSVGEEILSRALSAPFRTMLLNIGLSKDLVAKTENDVCENEGYAYDAAAGHLTPNPREDGIIDPVKVTKSAFKNALSIAGLLLTVGGAVLDD